MIKKALFSSSTSNRISRDKEKKLFLSFNYHCIVKIVWRPLRDQDWSGLLQVPLTLCRTLLSQDTAFLSLHLLCHIAHPFFLSINYAGREECCIWLRTALCLMEQEGFAYSGQALPLKGWAFIEKHHNPAEQERNLEAECTILAAREGTQDWSAGTSVNKSGSIPEGKGNKHTGSRDKSILLIYQLISGETGKYVQDWRLSQECHHTTLKALKEWHSAFYS